MTQSDRNADVFVADDDGETRRRLYIARDEELGTEGLLRGWVRGWAFICDEWRDGDWHPAFDTWERWFFQILQYPRHYAEGTLVWRREDTGELVDLAALQPSFDGVVAGPGELPEDVGLEP